MSNAAHRLLWTLAALVMVALGAAGLLLSLGALPGTDPDTVLLGPDLPARWRAAAPWSPLGGAAGGLLLALLGYRLLTAELRAPGPRTLLHRDGRHPGRTRVTARTLAAALERDLTRLPGVPAARVVLTGPPTTPDLWIALRLGPQAETAEVRTAVDAAVRRFATTAGCRPAHLDVTARPVHRSRP